MLFGFFLFGILGHISNIENILARSLWLSQEDNNFWKGIVAFFITYAIMMIFVFIFLFHEIKSGRTENLTLREELSALFVGNFYKLRNQLSSTVQGLSNEWVILVKHLIPTTLIIVLASFTCDNIRVGLSEFAKSPAANIRFGNYRKYPAGYQTVGIIMFTSAVVIVAIGFLLPVVFFLGLEEKY